MHQPVMMTAAGLEGEQERESHARLCPPVEGRGEGDTRVTCTYGSGDG